MKTKFSNLPGRIDIGIDKGWHVRRRIDATTRVFGIAFLVTICLLAYTHTTFLVIVR